MSVQIGSKINNSGLTVNNNTVNLASGSTTTIASGESVSVPSLKLPAGSKLVVAAGGTLLTETLDASNATFDGSLCVPTTTSGVNTSNLHLWYLPRNFTSVISDNVPSRRISGDLSGVAMPIGAPGESYYDYVSSLVGIASGVLTGVILTRTLGPGKWMIIGKASFQNYNLAGQLYDCSCKVYQNGSLIIETFSGATISTTAQKIDAPTGIYIINIATNAVITMQLIASANGSALPGYSVGTNLTCLRIA